MKLAVTCFFLLLTGVSAEECKDVRSALLNQEFNIKPGQSIEIKAEHLQVKFTFVLEDSRCPKGEQCISQGNGKIELELGKGDNHLTSVSLNTSSSPQEAAYGGHTVRLVALNPYPTINKVIHPDDYVATLVVLDTTDRNQ